MPLNIDSSQALRTPSKQRALVEAVRDAPTGTQERHSVEWKREGDADAKTWHVKLSRAILGFANRDPDAAAVEFEGCAYVLLGVEPGSLLGTAHHDASEVESWLEEYVGKGSDGPGWSPDYVKVGDRWVLLITVEAPRHGSRIWTLRKSFPQAEAEEKVPLREGTIFVRRGARTMPANAADVEALARRSCSTGKRVSGLTLILQPGSMAVPIDIGEAALATWEAKRRDALRPTPRATASRPESNADLLSGLAKTAAILASKMEDRRTLQQFEAEVNEYIESGKRGLVPALQRSAVIRGFGRVDLLLRNNTDRPYRDIEVVVSIDARNVAAFADSVDVEGPAMPTAPEPLGTRHEFGLVGRVPLLDLQTPYSAYANMGAVGDRVKIDNSGSATITFPAVDIRARKVERLDEFYLLVGPEYADQNLTAEWTATATDADGRDGGSVSIPVMGPPLDMTLLLNMDMTDIDFGDET